MLLHEVDERSPKRIINSIGSLGPLQLPSILASIATLVLLWFVAQAFFNRPIALLSVIALGFSYWHLRYSDMLRAYSLSTFVNLLNVWLLQQVFQRRGRLWLVALSFSLAIAHGLVLINGYYTVALLPWIVYSVWHDSPGDSERIRSLIVGVSLAFLAGLLMTWLIFRPTLGPFLKMVDENKVSGVAVLLGMRARLAEFLAVIGFHRYYRLCFGVTSLFGAAYAAWRREMRSWGLIFCISYLVIPFLLPAAQHVPIFTRIYISALPAWAMLFSVGVWGVLALAAERWGWPARRIKIAFLIGIAGMVALAGGEVYSFLAWNRGLDRRPAVNAVARMAREQDDLMVILPAPERSDLRGDLPLPWEYRGYWVKLRPFEGMRILGDYPYLIRKHYYLIAKGPEDARAMMTRSRVDRYLQKTLTPVQVFGKLQLYTLELNDSVLRDYRAAVETAADPSARVEALTGLGASAIKMEDFPQAVKWLSRAKQMRPEDPKVRFLLGMAHYLSFEDSDALQELSWVVAHDTANVHAPIYFADLLLEQGRNSEAASWYRWYFPGPPEAWFLQDRAEAGLKAALSASPPQSFSGSSAQRWASKGEKYFFRKAFERADQAMARAIRAEKNPIWIYHRAAIQRELRNFQRSIELIEQAMRLGANGESLQIDLAIDLLVKLRVQDSRAVLERLLKSDPNNPKALDMLQVAKRMREP